MSELHWQGVKIHEHLHWGDILSVLLYVHILVLHLVVMCRFLCFPQVRPLLQIAAFITLSAFRQTQLLVICTSLVTLQSCSTVMSQPLYATAG